MSDQKPPPPGAGWYPDQSGILRWWDGTAWTDHAHVPPADSNAAQPTTESTPAEGLRKSPRRWRTAALLAAAVLVLSGAAWGVYASGIFEPETPTVRGTSIAKTVSQVSAIGGESIPDVMTEDEVIDQYLKSICGYNFDIAKQERPQVQLTYSYLKPLSKQLRNSARKGAEILGPQPGKVWPAEYEDDRLKMRDSYISEFTSIRDAASATSEDDFWPYWTKWAEKGSKPFQRFKIDIGLPSSTDSMCKDKGYWK